MQPVADCQPFLPLGIAMRPRPEFWYDKPDWDDRAIEREVDALLASGEVTIPPSRYPLLKSYNGATGQERLDGGNKWMVALKRGLVPWAKMCSICASTKNLGAHNEVYARPCNARPICASCHRILHRRFYDPNPWLTLRQRCAYEGAWFLKIGLTELTRKQMLYLATLDDPFNVRQLGTSEGE